MEVFHPPRRRPPLGSPGAVPVVLGAIRRVVRGQVHVGESVASTMLMGLADPAAGAEPGVHLLSDREFEVFRLIGRGAGPSEAARILGVSVKTVETYRD